MAMALVAPANNAPAEDLKSREQGGGAVALIVVRHRPATAFLDRKTRLRSVQCLNLAFFVNAQYNRLLRRIKI